MSPKKSGSPGGGWGRETCQKSLYGMQNIVRVEGTKNFLPCSRGQVGMNLETGRDMVTQ